MQLAFNSGSLWGERVDTTGSGIGPQQFGVLQGCSIDFDYDLKELRGGLQFPVAIARASGKITGKASFARILGSLYSDLFFGATPATGQIIIAESEAGSIPASPAYTVTVSNAATFNDDLGVRFTNTGIAFKRVTTPSATGEYSVNESTGVYTFAAADASAAVKINYAYNNTTAGKKLTISNQSGGFTPTFKATFNQKVSPNVPGSGVQTLPMSLVLNACVASKLSFPAKIDDWQIPEFDFMAFADASDTVGTLSTVE